MNRAIVPSITSALLLAAAPAAAQELEPQGPERGPAPHLVLGVDGALTNMVHGTIYTIGGKVGGGVRLGSWALTAIFEADGGGGMGLKDIHEAAYWLFPQLDLARLDQVVRWHVFAGGGYARFDATAPGFTFGDRRTIYGGGIGIGAGWFDATLRYIAPAVPIEQVHVDSQGRVVSRTDYGTFGVGLQLLLGVRYDATLSW